jgi:hypothetical protein
MCLKSRNYIRERCLTSVIILFKFREEYSCFIIDFNVALWEYFYINELSRQVHTHLQWNSIPSPWCLYLSEIVDNFKWNIDD